MPKIIYIDFSYNDDFNKNVVRRIESNEVISVIGSLNVIIPNIYF